MGPPVAKARAGEPIGVSDSGQEWLRHMRSGDFAAAWRVSEAVLRAGGRGPPDDAGQPYHLRWVWDGRPFDGRHVLVRCYHGLGDTIQFARYLPLIGHRAATVTLEVHPSLVTLLQQVPGIDRIIPFDVTAPASPAECDIEIMELPFALRVPPDRVTTRYLTADAASLPPRTVGLCWEAGGWDPSRSVPEALFAAFTSGPSVTLLPTPTALTVINPDGAPRDMMATAALVAATSLVITVDTMVAHLAGAMHRPTWLMLKHDADWRWMADRANSPWYPTMRLYRQDTPGDWEGVVARVVADWRTLRPPSTPVSTEEPPRPDTTAL